MNTHERTKRDHEIMKLARAGIDALEIAKRHHLTFNRINQIIERERRKKKKLRKRS